MQFNGRIHKLPKDIKLLITTFIIVLSVGFYSGLLFVNETSSASPTGIQENYIGNENDEDAAIMKFKKSEREMLSIVHSHILSMSMIFFFVGLLVSITSLKKSLKTFLMIEPFFSVLFTFGGMYLLWKGILWMKYVVMVSGVIMTLTFTAAIIIILKELHIKKQIY